MNEKIVYGILTLGIILSFYLGTMVGAPFAMSYYYTSGINDEDANIKCNIEYAIEQGIDLDEISEETMIACQEKHIKYDYYLGENIWGDWTWFLFTLHLLFLF